jgi:hypothetical protein
VRPRGWIRVGGTLALGVGLVAFLTVVSSPGARAKAPTPIYFFSDNSLPINSHNPLVVRPAGFLVFLDGQWVLQDLHWTGWGSSVARATGMSNSSNDIPDAASGKRIKTWADMTLSHPVPWRGREVYSCFTVLVPPPASDLSDCILPNPPIGDGWLLLGADSAEFLAPGQNVSCIVNSANVICDAGPDMRTKDGAGARSTRSWVPPPLGASLYSTGTVLLCSVPSGKGGCSIDWQADPPVLRFGQEIRVGNFLCKSERSGVVCTIASGKRKGKGFLISSKVVRALA